MRTRRPSHFIPLLALAAAAPLAAAQLADGTPFAARLVHNGGQTYNLLNWDPQTQLDPANDPFSLTCSYPYTRGTVAQGNEFSVDLLQTGVVTPADTQHAVIQIDLVPPNTIVINFDSTGLNLPDSLQLDILGLPTPIENAELINSYNPDAWAVRTGVDSLRVSLPLYGLPPGDAETAVQLNFAEASLPTSADLIGDTVDSSLTVGAIGPNAWRILHPNADTDTAFIAADSPCPQFHTVILGDLQISAILRSDTITLRYFTLGTQWEQGLIPSFTLEVTDIDAPLSTAFVAATTGGAGFSSITNTESSVTLVTEPLNLSFGNTAEIDINLNFLPSLSFVHHPQPSVVDDGQDLVFTARVRSPNPFPFILSRWKKDGVDLADGPSPSGSTVSGATTPALLIQNATPADTGYYQYGAFDFITTVVSEPVIGAVRASPATNPADCLADLNEDGLLDLADITLFVSSFTAGCPQP
jgi:hypothetical protein